MDSTKVLIAAASAGAAMLGAAGANAATVGTDPVSVSAVSTASGATVSTHSASSTGTLDDSGTYTATFVSTNATILGKKGATITETDTFTGTYSGGTFTASGGSSDVTNCTGSPFCGTAVGNKPFNLSATGTLTLAAGGTLTGVSSTVATQGGVPITADSTYHYTAGPFNGTSPPPVPLPPAVWLLGSGLLGLVGTARRRRSAQ